jgi:hypothetical protein
VYVRILRFKFQLLSRLVIAPALTLWSRERELLNCNYRFLSVCLMRELQLSQQSRPDWKHGYLWAAFAPMRYEDLCALHRLFRI